jgi:hypothetical protein
VATAPRSTSVNGRPDPEFVVAVGDAFGDGDSKLAVEVMARFVFAYSIGNNVLHRRDSAAGHR